MQGRITSERRACLNIAGYATERLHAVEVGTVERLCLDTYADESRFYSYRRATHRGEPGYGREIALIGIG